MATESAEVLLHGWRYGIHPAAVGAQVRAIGRLELPLGETLRLEMASVDPAEGDVVHLQYYIDTEAGAWALWLTCSRANAAAKEATLREMTLPAFGAG